ncbi:MAG: zinc ribbon domain-containing protein [Anaerolineae bacterium]|nr:zinc ribbon domain-containing protein [Anaerolineae bacterium]
MAKKMDALLKEGIGQARLGRKREAEQLLRRVVTEDPENDLGWLWLSSVVSGIESQRECLNKVLEIDPINTHARYGLAFLARLRVGQEWRAAEAPWVQGLEETDSKATKIRCPHCGTQNEAWASSCSKCGAALKHVDVRESVRVAEQIRSRSTVSTAVIESWAGALTLHRKQIFDPEVELASAGRAITAIVLGVLLLVVVRLGLGLIPALVAGGVSTAALTQVGLLAVQDLGILLGSAIGVTLLLAVPTFVTRGLGGKGNFTVHFHMVAVAVSCWLVIVTLGVLALNLPGLFVAPSTWNALRPTLDVALGGVLAFYAFVLLAEAVQAGQRINPIVAFVVTGVVVAAGVAAYLTLGASLPGAQAFVVEMWGRIRAPL